MNMSEVCTILSCLATQEALITYTLAFEPLAESARATLHDMSGDICRSKVIMRAERDRLTAQAKGEVERLTAQRPGSFKKSC